MTRHLVVYCDGASRGNPGTSAIGVVIEHDGKIVYGFGAPVGIGTNNQAEYKSLQQGLTIAEMLGGSSIEIYMDSLLVVNQVNGKYRIRNDGLVPLYNGVIASLAKFDRWSIHHIPRDKNRRADGFANRALDLDMPIRDSLNEAR